MRIKAIRALGIPPIKKFEVDDLSDTIVIAGPNGVGKSRFIQHIIAHIQNFQVSPTLSLIVEATDKTEEEKWGQSSLDTKIQGEANILKTALTQSQRKRHWEGSIVFFESDRTIQQIKPFAFTWDLA